MSCAVSNERQYSSHLGLFYSEPLPATSGYFLRFDELESQPSDGPPISCHAKRLRCALPTPQKHVQGLLLQEGEANHPSGVPKLTLWKPRQAVNVIVSRTIRNRRL